MRKVHIFFLIVTLIGCTQKEYNFDFNGKWVLLTTEYNGQEIRGEIIHNPLLSYTLRNKKLYPAIRFNNLDSTVIVPGTNTNKEKIQFSVDENLKNIKFFKKENSDKTSLIDNLFLNNFKINKDTRLGRLILQSDSIKITMMPSERFATMIKLDEIDK
jgi:uncharacterized lipoprotein YehR (DUF1307 family)